MVQRGSIGGGSPIAHVQDNFTVNAGGGISSFTPIINGTAAGNFFVILISGNASAENNLATAVVFNGSSNGASCSHSPGTFINSGVTGSEQFSDIWYCMNNPTSANITFNFGFTTQADNSVNGPRAMIGEFSGVATTAADAGLGNTFNASTTSMSISTTGAVPQTNDLVVSSNIVTIASPTAIGGSQIDFTSDTGKNSSYQLITSGTITHTYAMASQQVTGSIAAFKHP
jgi:hypothetical protein